MRAPTPRRANASGARRGPPRLSVIRISASFTRLLKTATSCFLVMELLEGQSLSDKLQAGPLSPHDALAILLPVLEALEALHARGIVHRDLKPSNVFVTGYGVKPLDFGLAQTVVDDVMATAANLTVAGQVVGTPAYMAPEQLDGSQVDVRADLFAAGVLLFDMVTRSVPVCCSVAHGVDARGAL